MAPIGFAGNFNQSFGGNRAVNSGFNTQGAVNNFAANVPAKPKPTPAQVVKAAGKFDTDRDHQLDREELSEMATAVITELKRTSETHFEKLTRRTASVDGKLAKPPTAEEIKAAFVEQCRKYDRDDDKTLDAVETRRMAAALIKSLN